MDCFELESWIMYSFLSWYVLLVVGLEKWSKDLGFENFDAISSLLDFDFIVWVLLRLPSSFPSQLILLMVVQSEYMKLDVGKVVDHMTRESCVPTDSVKSGDYSSLVHNIGTGHILSQIIPIRHIWLIHIVHSRVGVIRVKWGRGEIWICWPKGLPL